MTDGDKQTQHCSISACARTEYGLRSAKNQVKVSPIDAEARLRPHTTFNQMWTAER